MLHSQGGEKNLLLTEISGFNVPVKRRSFPKEASEILCDSLDSVLSLAVSLHKFSPLAYSAYSLFVLFPRLLLRPLPNGCKGRFADAALRKRCALFLEGNISQLLVDSHEVQTDKATVAMNAASSDSVSFSKTARVVILAGA